MTFRDILRRFAMAEPVIDPFDAWATEVCKSWKENTVIPTTVAHHAVKAYKDEKSKKHVLRILMLRRVLRSSTSRPCVARHTCEDDR